MTCCSTALAPLPRRRPALADKVLLSLCGRSRAGLAGAGDGVAGVGGVQTLALAIPDRRGDGNARMHPGKIS